MLSVLSILYSVEKEVITHFWDRSLLRLSRFQMFSFGTTALAYELPYRVPTTVQYVYCTILYRLSSTVS